MAVTISNQPKSIQPAYNQSRLTLFQNKTFVDSKFNYKFYAVATLKSEASEPFPESIRINCTPILTDAGSSIYNAFFDFTEFLSSSKLIKQFPIVGCTIDYGEQYATSAGGLVTSYNSGSIVFDVINGSLSVSEYIEFDPTAFSLTPTSANIARYAFTDYTDEREVLRSSENQLYFTNSPSGTVARLMFYNDSTFVSSAQQVASSPVYAFSKIVANQGLIPLGANRMEIQLVRSNNNPISPIYKYRVAENCGRYTPVTVYFDNKYGMRDNFLFKLVSNKTDTIERTKYERIPRYLDDWQPSQVVSSSKIGRKHNLTTDWVNEKQMNTLLRDLAESNYVQLYYGDELVGGQKASFKIVFTYLAPDAFGNVGVQSGWNFTISTAAGNYSYTTSGYIGDIFADNAMTALIANISANTTIDSVYDITIGNSTSTYAELLFTAKLVGVQYSWQGGSTSPSDDPSEAASVFSSQVAGTNSNPTNFINCIPNTTEFKFRKKENEDLFLLEAEFIEAQTFSRQVL